MFTIPLSKKFEREFAIDRIGTRYNKTVREKQCDTSGQERYMRQTELNSTSSKALDNRKVARLTVGEGAAHCFIS